MAAITTPSGTKIHEFGADIRSVYDIKEQIGKYAPFLDSESAPCDRLLTLLFRGMFSVVYKGVHKGTKQEVAIKVINKRHVKKLDKKSETRLETVPFFLMLIGV